MGACLDTEMIRVLGAMRGGMGFGEGGVKEMQVTTQKTPLNEVGRQGHRFYAH